MLNIGFWELVLVAIVAIVVLGPEKLPKVLQSMGRFYAKTKRMFNSVNNEFNFDVTQPGENNKNNLTNPHGDES